MPDDFIRARLEDPHSKKAEALGWLKESGGKNTIGELETTAESIALIGGAYEAGAVAQIERSNQTTPLFILAAQMDVTI